MAGVVVQKFGGTSVATAARIRFVAEKALRLQREGTSVVLVTSAMSGETDRLLALTREISACPALEEQDAVLASGEQVTAALTALAIQAAGGRARSYLAYQIPILTDSSFADARISDVNALAILESLGRGEIPVVAGFQGVNAMNQITTLGRGGSDTTAVAVAVAVKAQCQIFTDVDGVFSADPAVCPDAVKWDRLTYSQMQVMASLGAKVLQRRSVALAQKYQIPLEVRSTFSEQSGTQIGAFENTLVRAVVCDRDVAIVEIEADSIAEVTRRLASLKIPCARTELAQGRICVQVRRRDLARIEPVIPCRVVDRGIAKISLVGDAIGADPILADTALSVLTSGGVRVRAFQSEDLSLSMMVAESDADSAVRILHREFVTGNVSEGGQS